MKNFFLFITLIIFSFCCTAQTMCGTTDEGGTISLTAPSGNVFTSVVFASYGTPNGSCGSFTIGGCNAANSVSLVQTAFVGQNSGSIGANNGVFGDPCGGTFKRLYVELAYASALPLKLISFAGSSNGNTNLLKWETTDEKNTKQFNIERSTDGNNFSNIGSVVSNNTSGTNYYSYTDNLLSSSTQFYRLKMIDQDGSFTYSNIIKLESNIVGQFAIYPNPSKDQLTISGLQSKGLVEIISIEGKLLQKINVIAQTQTINISDLTHGIYIVKYKSDNSTAIQKMVKE